MTVGPASVSAALDAAVTRFAAMVKGVAWRHRLSDGEIDELVQEVRIRLWRARGDGEKIATAPASYMYRTATSAALDLIRRRRATHGGESDPGELDSLAATGADASPEVVFEEHELQRKLLFAVERLDGPRRAVVRMYLAGRPHQEIADLLGWSEAKTRNLLYRGLHDLRRRLADLGVGVEDVR